MSLEDKNPEILNCKNESLGLFSRFRFAFCWVFKFNLDFDQFYFSYKLRHIEHDFKLQK